MDLLVRLYDLKADPALASRVEAAGFTVRRILPTELRALLAFIEARFGDGWASEATIAVTRQPPSCFIAVREGEIAGFSCYDTTARGFFGPTAVDEAARGNGAGHALLLAALLDMRIQGYGYGIIGGVGPVEFYARTVGATPIEGSSPGIYRDLLPSIWPNAGADPE